MKMDSLVFDPDQIIWSADLKSPRELRHVIDSQVLPRGMWIKIDQKFVLDAFLAPAKSLRRDKKSLAAVELTDLAPIKEFYELWTAIEAAGYKIFLDWKMSEVPTKCEGIISAISGLLPAMLNCMAGSLLTTGVLHAYEDREQLDGLVRYARACANLNIHPCAVTVLTSKNGEIVKGEFGRYPTEQVVFYAEAMLRAGFTDLVCSANEAAAIRQNPTLDRLRLNCPGIRLPNSDLRDQSADRVATPQSALKDGVDRLVIGSDLTGGRHKNEPDLAKRIALNLQEIKNNIEGRDASL